MDVVSWTFSNTDYDQNREIYIEPDKPERSITAQEARCMVKKLAAGFKAAGLQRGDCVCIHAFNDVGLPLPLWAAPNLRMAATKICPWVSHMWLDMAANRTRSSIQFSS